MTKPRGGPLYSPTATARYAATRSLCSRCALLIFLRRADGAFALRPTRWCRTPGWSWNARSDGAQTLLPYYRAVVLRPPVVT